MSQNALKSGVYPSEIIGITEFFPYPETRFRLLSSSRESKSMVCGLDHSGSQPFNCNTLCGLNFHDLDFGAVQYMHCLLMNVLHVVAY